MEPQERVHLQQVIKQLEGQLNTYHELLERERSMTRRHPLVGIQRMSHSHQKCLLATHVYVYGVIGIEMLHVEEHAMDVSNLPRCS